MKSHFSVERQVRMPIISAPSTADTCLFGSVVGLDNLLALDDVPDTQVDTSVATTSTCDECDQRPAHVTCHDCGLVYCATCDTHRHRKGKLQWHPRTQLARHDALEAAAPRDTVVTKWTLGDVCAWLEAHELGVFVHEAKRQRLTGASLASPEALNTFLETLKVPSVITRGYKKKLQREVQKLVKAMDTSSVHGEAAREPAAVVPKPRIPSRARVGLELRIDVTSRARGSSSGPSSRPSFQSLKIHEEDDGDANASRVCTERSKKRPACGALGLEMAAMPTEDEPVAASFDFSATGRLQTQGFEIDTRGIANVPFAKSREPQAHGHKAMSASTDALSTKDSLILLEELGQGASGKVYKALYMPTFLLVAVKVIRVYDQQKRHQMVRELQSLSMNVMPLSSATFPSSAAPTQAACDELVGFYNAYTNPDAGTVSIVLEYMDGGSLQDYVQRLSNSPNGAPRWVSEQEIASIAVCGLKGLAFLHEHHQLHRDIKLSNLLLNRQGHVKKLTMGIMARYMAPERISGGVYSYPSDIWSLGLALLACAIGKVPVPTTAGYWGVVHAVQAQPFARLEDYGDHFSVEFAAFLDQCLQKNPRHRPSATALLAHPFITKNYAPTEAGDARFRQDHQALTAKARQDLERIADKAQAWCRDHDEAFKRLACLTASLPNKLEILAKQLRLPVEEVQRHFAFLSDYC
ncbi:hypothetical protein PsorP6_011998 [Peronosclerospora sorghi]|uniref:Uncharacterized protein n=1 Tax=Peronosclerospora sorghi TaxID=230839 RepID=A0ACC0WKG5_9STRA|nr:hypothetical protein PsorP6_011998 [Peronosclerospora sorghi]